MDRNWVSLPGIQKLFWTGLLLSFQYHFSSWPLSLSLHQACLWFFALFIWGSHLSEKFILIPQDQDVQASHFYGNLVSLARCFLQSLLSWFLHYSSVVLTTMYWVYIWPLQVLSDLRVKIYSYLYSQINIWHLLNIQYICVQEVY